MSQECNIPGPIEVTDEVLYANAHPSMSHMSADFAYVFGNCLRMTRDILYSANAQPFLIAGSGTLGWDQVRYPPTLSEPGENALVLHSGYFADGFADCLRTYGANVDQVKAEVGDAVKESDIETALKSKNTVLSNIKGVAEVARRVSPDTLVCVVVIPKKSVWTIGELTVVLTASQKGLGTPPGLSILVASQRAIKVYENRKTPITSYYASWKKWLPIMNAYERNGAAYFATPPVNLIYAYHASLQQIVQGPAHKEASRRVKHAAAALGLRCVPLGEDVSANGMTAIYFPDGLTASDIIPRLLRKDIVVAGGLHASIKGLFMYLLHMGATAVDTKRGDVDRVINALNETLAEAKASKV
ncbi:pyridoxal phosphate-dependent transferase [Pisolithus croceorrhizus]|nr:pyridoxal phosphate-dependent transferase [Pisolithus croceorrhizus]